MRRKKKRDDESTVPGTRYRYLIQGVRTVPFHTTKVRGGSRDRDKRKEKSWWVSVNNVYFIHEIPTTFHRRKKKYNYKLKSQNVNLDSINIYRELIKFNFRYISAILIFVLSRKASYFCFQSASGKGLRINEEIISNQPPLIIRTARSTSTKSTPNTPWKR